MMLCYIAVATLFVLGCSARKPNPDCSSDRFSCQYNNPCAECTDNTQFFFPGRTPNRYILCSGPNNDICTVNRCPRKTYWNQENLRCETRNGVDARCSHDVYNCQDRNPCEPLCYEGVTRYPMGGVRAYVQCGVDDGGSGSGSGSGSAASCEELACPRRTRYNHDRQECVPLM